MPLRPCDWTYGGPTPSRFGGRAVGVPRWPRWGCLARGVGGAFCLRRGKALCIGPLAQFSAGSLGLSVHRSVICDTYNRASAGNSLQNWQCQRPNPSCATCESSHARCRSYRISRIRYFVSLVTTVHLYYSPAKILAAGQARAGWLWPRACLQSVSILCMMHA